MQFLFTQTILHSLGRTERAKSGLWHGGGWNPYGYRYIDGKLVVDPTEKLIVLDIYKLFLNSMPIHAITKTINQKYGRSMGRTVIRSILTTKLYTGIIQWRGKIYPGQHDAIIDDLTFKRAQVLMNDRSRIAASKPFPFKSRTLLGGLLFCGHCGARYFSKGNYSGHGKKKIYFPYYYCYSRGKTVKRLILDPNCKNPVYSVRDLDKIITEEIKHLANDENYFDKTIEENTMLTTDDITSQRAGIMQRIDEIETQRKRLLDLYQLGTIEFDEVDDRMKKLENEQTALQCTLDATERHKTEKLPRNTAQELLVKFVSISDDEDIDDRKSILSELIEKIIVKSTPGEFDIMWNF